MILPWLLASWLAAQDERKLAIGLAVLWMLFVVARSLAVEFAAPHPWIWTSLFCADSLLLGTWLGARRASVADPRLRVLCIVAGLVGLASPAFFTPIQVLGWHQVPIYTFVAIGAALLCISTIESVALKPVLANRPIRYLGKISYGLYVFHLLAIELAGHAMRRIGSDSWPLTAILALTLTVLISASSYAVLEKPFLRLKHRFETVRTRPV